MKLRFRGLVIVFSAALAGQPCLAASDTGSGYAERHSGVFMGAAVKMELGGKDRALPTARLQLGMSHRYQGVGFSAPGRSFNVSALELGLSGTGKPALLVGGHAASNVQRRLGVKGSTGTALLIGGAALAALAVVLLVTDEQPCAIPEGGC